MQDLVSVFLESVQAYLTQARDLENIHNEKMTESATSALEKAAKNELDEDVPEELKMVRDVLHQEIGTCNSFGLEVFHQQLTTKMLKSCVMICIN